MKYVYIVMASSTNFFEETSPPTAIGVFTSRANAEEYIAELESDLVGYWGDTIKDVYYLTIKYKANSKLLTKSKKPVLTMEDIENELETLIKEGLVEALIGEDGHFYYNVTKKGEEVFEKGFGETE